MRRRIGATIWARTAAAAAAVLTLSAAGATRAQVNAEMLRQNLLKPGFSINIDGTFAVARGNVEVIDVGAAGRIQYQTLYPVAPAVPGQPAPLPFVRQRVYITGSGRFAESAAGPFTSQTFLHMRWTGMWHPRVGSDAFVQHQYNRFFRLQRRSLAGAGLRVEIVHDPVFLWWGGTGYMAEYELINVQPGAPDDPETLSHRWTSYLTERLTLAGGRLLLQSTTYFQPRFDDFSDFRILQELEGLARITDILGFGLTMSILHDSAPPTGVKDTDLRLTSSVRVSL
jgi:Protein of unknown function, DUF481